MRTLNDMLAVGPGERLLDVATGTAAVLADLASRRVRPESAVGVDTSAEMLALAPRLPAGWELEVADATSLPFDDASFDVITASYLLHLLGEAQRHRVIAELHRVLRPGGRLGTITVAPPRGCLTGAIAAPLIAATRRSTGSLASLRPLDPRAELAAAGFEGIDANRTLLGYPSLCVIAHRAA